MSTLLVLGGADGSLGTIEAARRLGIATLCVDRRSDAPAVTCADEYLSLSTLDVEAIVRAVSGRADLVGVMSPASDVNLPAQFALARRLGLPVGLSGDAVHASTDKGFFRDVCRRIGLAGPAYLQGTVTDVVTGRAALRPPLMVKPSDSSGGRGVSRCDDPSDLADACAEAARWSASGSVIVEEHVDGVDMGAEAFVIDGRIALLAVGVRELTEPPHFVTRETHVQAPGEQSWAEIRRCLDAVCQALGYRWGSLNADLIVRPDGRVVIVEIGARLGGNGSLELLGLSHGLDANESAVLLATGATPDLRPRASRYAAFRVLEAPAEGKLLAIEGDDAARAVPGIFQVLVAAQPGEHVAPYTRAGAKIGYLLAAAESRAAVVAALDRAQALLRVEVCPMDDEAPAGSGLHGEEGRS